ncbi:HAD domain-containing protein [Burkholderia sp. Ac-20365]|uniref:HAD domain-containing protein n=1 Tax=Burkholderia sp. Ac-20365 TaxID=2703897 RepID=UPI00197B5D23|nr:HAD domain-containing protein [Burkholderia sp. Ac-20365]MBN3762329.1 hypothetical protein [Burkholderia sp. Ac-20365]
MSPSRATAIAPPTVTGGLILYLDFDGVLHPSDVWRRAGRPPYVKSPPGHRVFEHADLLVEVLAPFPDIRIVLSTSWVSVFKGVVKAARYLPEELRLRVIGATWHSAMDGSVFARLPRSLQILTDVHRRRPMAWLALDDDDEEWPAWCRSRLIHTHPVLGIGDVVALTKLRNKLSLEMVDSRVKREG